MTGLIAMIMAQYFTSSDATLTTDNVADAMELVNDWRSLQGNILLDKPVIIPSSQLSAIEKKSPTKREAANKCASYYVQCHPLASWTHLSKCLYCDGEFAAVEKLKPFLPVRGEHLVAMVTFVYM